MAGHSVNIVDHARMDRERSHTRRWTGHGQRCALDVHKDTIAVAVLRPGQHPPDERVISNTPEA